MKRNILWTRKTILSTLIALVFSTAIVSVGTSSPIPTINQANPATNVYLDPPTIIGTAIGEEFNVSIMIRDASSVYAWNGGLIFNATLLNCTSFSEGEFLRSVGATYWFKGVINQTTGVVSPYGCTLLGEVYATGSGRLAYATFKVKALGISDIHLSNVKVLNYDLKLVPVNIIDVFTVILDTTAHTVVTVSNSTDTVGGVPSGLYGHSFNQHLKELSFKVTGPHSGFSNVTIPKTLLPPPDPPYVWAVIVDGRALSIEKITKSDNTTHTSIYFTYDKTLHTVQITTRFRPSTISITLSKKSISLGESVTVSGAIDPVRSNKTVMIQSRMQGEVEWIMLENVTTDENSEYTYVWKPEKIGIYEVVASWEGDEETLSADSEVKTLEVVGAAPFPLGIVAVVVVVIIVIVAVAIYFIKIRKPKS